MSMKNFRYLFHRVSGVYLGVIRAKGDDFTWPENTTELEPLVWDIDYRCVWDLEFKRWKLVERSIFWEEIARRDVLNEYESILLPVVMKIFNRLEMMDERLLKVEPVRDEVRRARHELDNFKYVNDANNELLKKVLELARTYKDNFWLVNKNLREIDRAVTEIKNKPNFMTRLKLWFSQYF